MHLPPAGMALALLVLAIAALPAPIQLLLEYNREAILLHGEWWRVWSGHLAHYGLWHAAANCAAIILLDTILEKNYRRGLFIILLAVAAPVISMVILFAVPDMSIYRGASGLVAMMAALSLSVAAPQLKGYGRILLYAAGLGIFFKLILESRGMHWGLSGLPASVEVAWQAHAAGLFLALVWYSLFPRLRNQGHP